MKNAKENYYNNTEDVISESHTHNPKLYWQLPKRLLKSNANAKTTPPLKLLQIMVGIIILWMKKSELLT